MSACGNCPDAVTYTLRETVQVELDKVQALSDLGGFVSRALQDVALLAIDVIDTALNAIPVLPGLDFAEILGFLTCPLTPLALVVDFDQFINELDPTIQLQRVKSLGRSLVNKARRDYEDIINASDFRQVINLARRYSNEFLRLAFNPVSFAKAVVISATVLAVCGEEEYQAGPYQDFANAISNFSVSTNGVPASMDQNVAALVQRLIEADLRLKAMAVVLV